MDTIHDTRLSSVQPGKLAYVRGIENTELKSKLMEMGIVRGQPLFVLFKAPFGDPMAINVNGYILSLRLDEARFIVVEQIEETQVIH
jgi:ferrous iron transport protein A